MNAPKPSNTLAGKTCRACGEGKFELVQITHFEKIPNDNPVTVADVWVDRCNHCGEILFPGETAQFIEMVVADSTEQLTSQDLEQIRELLGVRRQDDMSEILGLGEKTFHKWESGSQVPTRSMSYYIRVLAEFPEAFEWLKRRGWRGPNRIAKRDAEIDWSAIFPDLPEAPNRSRVSAEQVDRVTSFSSRRNPALGLSRVAFLVK
jgi:putative zinc finger/helix-turn-helix YgiT family protein